MEIIQNHKIFRNQNQRPIKQLTNRNPNTNSINENFISLINVLIDSVKSYYNASTINNFEANKFYIYYKEEEQNIQILLNEIINNNYYQRLNELYDKINILNKIVTQLQDNSNSSLQNLNSFFSDAKTIFQNLRMQRQMQINQNSSKKIPIPRNNKFQQINNFSQAYEIYIILMQLLFKLSEFNYILEEKDLESANNYNNLQIEIKKYINILFNLINSGNNNEKDSRKISLISQGNRSNSLNKNFNKEIENLQSLNISKDKKIRELSYRLKKIQDNEFNTERNNTEHNYNISINENEVDLKIKRLERMIKDKDNKLKILSNQNNFENILNEKNNQIYILQKQLSNLANNFQTKMSQNDRKIKFLENKLQNNINDESQILKNNFSTEPNNNNILNMKNKANNTNPNKELVQYKTIINKLKNEINNYKNRIKQYEELNQKHIVELNNNIFRNNKIIQQKDEIINQLRLNKEISNPQMNMNINNQLNNNEISLKIENEKLKKEISKLKSSGNYTIQNNNNINKFKELNKIKIEEINSYKIKVTQLNEEIKQLKSKNENLQKLIEQQKVTITNLESNISKKDEEAQGLKDFIAKLQNQLENTNNINISSNKKNGANSNPKDIQKIKDLLDQLNKSYKDNTLLQKKNKELQFKLEEKEVEKELSGFRTEEVNFSNYEEEFDLRKIISGAKDKNRSEDINIDYPGMQGVKDKNKELQINLNMLQEQIKILLLNIDCNNSKIKPQISQICQLMGILPKNIPLIFNKKFKKKALGYLG